MRRFRVLFLTIVSTLVCVSVSVSFALNVSGVVLNEDGKPVVGATVRAFRCVYYYDDALKQGFVAQSVAEKNGGFRLSNIPQTDPDLEYCQLVVYAPGFGVGWPERLGTKTSSRIVIVLPKVAPVKGRVTDKNGRPAFSSAAMKGRSLKFRSFRTSWTMNPARSAMISSDFGAA